MTVSFRHSQRDRGLDCYPTPPVAVEALLCVEELPFHLWEPAAGHGPIVTTLREAGHRVAASDIRHYTFELDFEHDFLEMKTAPAGVEAICTNPPYQIANQFTRHALDLVPRVYLLLRLSFLTSVGRTDILEERGLACVHIFRNRLPSLHRDGWTGNRVSNPFDYAWFVWDQDHVGPAIINRISWTVEDASS